MINSKSSFIAFVVLLQHVSFLSSCQDPNKHIIQYDHTKIAIIKYHGKHFPFDSTYKSSSLTQLDLANIDSILTISVNNWNNSLEKGYKGWVIDLNKRSYKIQLVAVTNRNGEKEVWVNCFCDTPNYDWQNKVYFVEDGANCFFNLKINLNTKVFYDFMVNSAA